MEAIELERALRHDVVAIVYDQLPRALRDQLVVRVQSDAHFIRCKAIFTTNNNRQWECWLEEGDVGGVTVTCRVPDDFITQLCALV